MSYRIYDFMNLLPPDDDVGEALKKTFLIEQGIILKDETYEHTRKRLVKWDSK